MTVVSDTSEPSEGPNPWARPAAGDSDSPAEPRGEAPGQTRVAPRGAPEVPTQRQPEPVEAHRPEPAARPTEPAVRPPEPVGPPPPEPAPAPGGHGRFDRKKIIAAAAALVVLLGLVAGGLYLHARGDRTVTLLGLDAPGDDPFAPNLVLNGSIAPTARYGPGASRTPTGDLDGLYFDNSGSPSCNRAPLDGLLRSDPRLAAAWSGPLGVPSAGAAGYLSALTPARLRADARMTAYHYSDGAATSYPAVLQAGSAVLVDDRGIPRVRCADGGPLAGPQPVADPYYGGADWTGFDPAAMLEVRPAATAVREFGLVDNAGLAPFRRPAGSTGDNDVAQLPETGRFAATYVLTGPQSACTGLQNCGLTQQGILLAQFSGCPGACSVSDLNFLTDGTALSRDGNTYRSSGNLPAGRGLRCAGQPSPSVFSISITPTRSAVVGGIWQATEVKADYEMRSPPSGGCVAAVLGWSLTGSGS
jgi:hypothetical protein